MDPFLAQIVMFGGNFNPRGWAFCDGQILPINQNDALFSLLGTTYGGDGRTTFALPDLRGRVAMHPGNGSGLRSRRLGEKGGIEDVTLNATQIPPLTGTIQTAPDANLTDTSDGNNFAHEARGGGNALDIYTSDTTNKTMRADIVRINGGGQSHTNIQPFTCVNYIIAIFGTFPSRN